MTCHGSALLVLAFVCAAGASASKCDVTFYGALAGNRTGDARLNAAAFQAALHVCDVVHVPPGVFKITPVVLPSHTTLWLDAGASLVGSDLWRDYGVTDFMPRMGRAKQLRPLLSATNATNITITGGNGTIDGNGWFAWPARNWSNPECGLHNHCAPSVFFGNATEPLRPPHVVTFIGSTAITLTNVTIKNSGFWGLQHFYCNNSYMSHVTITAPRWTRQIAGFMPWSVINYTVEDSYVAVGDDAVAIMSGPGAPSRDMVFRRLYVRGRSVAIGSADSGDVTNVLFDECTIGDDAGSSPWAFKVKMHVNQPGTVSGITFRHTKFGNISANTWQDSKPYPAIQMGMNYDGATINPAAPQPTIRNISFINVTATRTTVAGMFEGSSGDNPITELHFDGCNFRATSKTPWTIANVSVASCTSRDTWPPFPSAQGSTEQMAVGA